MSKMYKGLIKNEKKEFTTFNKKKKHKNWFIELIKKL